MTAVYLSIGSNVDRDLHIPQALEQLEALFGAMTCSTIYESEAVGFEGDPFYNLVVGFETDLALEQLLQRLQSLEEMHRRVRGGERFAPRTLDIDLLLYGSLVSSEHRLPRDEILTCAFVLLPLAEIAPDLHHPLHGRSYRELWHDFDQPGQRLWPVSLPELR